jgi:acetolactate synthase I/II/III large subunit
VTIRSSPSARTVADELLDYLGLEGVTRIFGIPGAGVAHLIHRLRVRPEFTYVVCRQESGAAYMADGYYRATGTPGVVLVTSGPGATNALTGTMNANFDGSAVMTLTGEVPQLYLGRGYLQEGVDCGLNVHDVYASGVRYSADIISASGAPTIIEQALRTMLAQPRRAVRIGINDDVAGSPAETTLLSPRPPSATTAYRGVQEGAPETGLTHALEVLATAKRPLIFLGNGCREAVRDPATARALRCLAEYWQIPVMTTSDGKGVFPETHCLSLRSYGFAGCQWPRYWMQNQDGSSAHDALMVLGSSLGELATNKWNPMLAPNGPFIQVDIDQAMVGRGFPVTDPVVAEAGAFLRDLWKRAPAWPRDEKLVDARAKEVASIKSQYSPFVSQKDYDSEDEPLQPAALCRVLNEVLPGDALVFIDCGNCVGWGLHCLIIGPGQELHSSLAMGPMGFAVCGIIGARMGRPKRTAVALVGDGAFLMHCGEISTAAAHRVGAIWVVLIDDDLHMVTQGQEKFFPQDGGYEGAYSLGSPDLRKVAEGLGADAFEVKRPADLRQIWPQVTKGAAAGRPQAILARIDRKAAPPYWYPPYWQDKVE